MNISAVRVHSPPSAAACPWLKSSRPRTRASRSSAMEERGPHLHGCGLPDWGQAYPPRSCHGTWRELQALAALRLQGELGG